MKRIFLLLILVLFLSNVGYADFLGIKQASEFIAAEINKPLDSLYGIPRAPDSVHILTYADNGNAAAFVTRSTTPPFSDISIDTLNYSGSVSYVLVDQIQDIDGAGGNVQLAIEIKTWYDDVATSTFHSVQVISDSLNTVGDSAILAATALKPTTAGRALDVTAAGEAGLDLDNTVGTLSKTEIPYLAHFDTSVYRGPRGMGVYLDSAAANTNTVVGTDGTCKNPVSTLVAARTLVDALGCKRYYFLNMSTFNGATVDLAADHQGFEFIGIGDQNAMAFGGQRVDGSRFENMTLSGVMHGSGGDVLYHDCIFGYVSSNFNGHADNCFLTDTIVLKVSKDILFNDCQSGVAGNKTPTIDMTGGSSTIVMTNYSGGIRIMSGSSNDTISVQTDGQVIISANNTSLNITLRGMLTPTDSGTTTNLTKDAVFSRSEADLWVWSNTDTLAVDSSLLGEWLSTSIPLVDSIYDSIKIATTDIANVRSYMDTLIYAGRVWLDAAASNTNTVVGTDGTRSNPVSTIAAATTVATSLGIQRIYLVNSSSITLAQTYNGWEFIGIGINNTINFGGQDVDKSYFERVTVSGIQGGTSMIYLECCGINGADSLEVLAENCWIMGTNSVKQATDITFNQCKSAVAGAGTPSLSFNSAPGAVNVKFRHYSGGLEVLLMTTNHTMSFEGMGQFVINANCTSANLALRGLIFVTNNGTTTNFLQNKDAVFSRQEAEFWVWANVDTALTIDTSDIGTWLSTGISASLSDANMGAIADSVWDKILADAIAVAGGMGKHLSDSINAIIDSINNSATAAIVMDSMSNRGFTQYDSSQAILQLAGITVTATANNNAVTLAGSGTGEGLKSTGGTTGNGIEAIGGSSTGNALRASTSTSQAAISAVSTTGPGIYAQGKYGLQTVGQTSYGFLAEGSKVSGDSAGIASVSGGTDPDFLATLLESEWEKVWYNIDTTNIDTSDIGTWLSTGVNATLSDAAMGAIGDTVWLKDTTGLLTAGRYGLEATTGGAASISDAAISLMMDSMSLRGHITYDSNGVLQLSGLYIIATPGGESTAVELQGDGAGHALYAHGDLAANAGNTGYGIYSRAAYNGLYGILANAITTGGRAIGATSTGNNGVALYLQGLLDGMEIVAYDPDGRAVYIHNDSGDGVVIWANVDSVVGYWDGGTRFYDTTDCTGDCDSVTGINKHALEMQTWGINDDVMRILANTLYGDGISITGGDSAQDIDATLLKVDTVNYVKFASISGSGDNAVTIKAVDTSGTDALVADVKLTIKDLTGTFYTAEYSQSNGAFIFNLDADTFLVSGRKLGFIWNVFDTIVVSAAQTDTLEGYNIVVGSPATDTLCRVYGYIHDIQGNPIEDVVVTASLRPRNARDTCTGVIIGDVIAKKPTNSAGYFFIDLIRSVCYNKSSAKYEFIGTYPSGKSAFRTIKAVPDSTTYQLTW